MAKNQMTEQELKLYIDDLYEDSTKYYQTGQESSLSDEEFDEKINVLEQLSSLEEYKKFFLEGSKGFNLLEGTPSLGTTSERNVIKHDPPMFSLQKAKTIKELSLFLTRVRHNGGEKFRLQAKLDGMAVSVKYDDGKISYVSTRGDGSHGEDITYITKRDNITIKGLPNEVNVKESFEIRGELFFRDTQFREADNLRISHGEKRFKNSRNALVGLVKSAEKGFDYPVEFTLAYYTVITEKEYLLSDFSSQFLSVNDLTKKSAPNIVLSDLSSDQDIMNSIKKFGEAKQFFDYPTDGVVIKPMNEKKMNIIMGATSHHPVSQLAWKYPSETATTTVKNIVNTVGRSGKITPVASFEPTLLDGSTITHASLHNFNNVHTKDIRVGSLVVIEKANEIIPQIKVVISNPENTKKVDVPRECPSCHVTLIFDREDNVWPPRTIICPNEDCAARKFSALKSAVGKNMLDIDGLSHSTLEFLVAEGKVKTVADFYDLNVNDLAETCVGISPNGHPKKLGVKRAEHIYQYIQKSKTHSLVRILSALAVDLLGESASKDLLKNFGNIDNIMKATIEQMKTIEGWGSIKAEKIHAGLRKNASLIKKMRDKGVVFSEGDKMTGKNKTFNGVSFCISGDVPSGYSNRKQWIDDVEKRGGVYHSTPKKDTDYMIGDPHSSSSKNRKAVELGVKFITPDDFMRMAD